MPNGYQFQGLNLNRSYTNIYIYIYIYINNHKNKTLAKERYVEIDKERMEAYGARKRRARA